MSAKKWLVLLLSFIIIGCTYYTVYAAVLENGSKGSEVAQVQTRLKQWGYYSGAVDGNYGQKTAAAVRKFQKKYGLKQTGKVDDATALKLGVQALVNQAPDKKNSDPAGKTSVSSKSMAAGNNGDVNLLSRMVYAEARGEPQIGKVAVAAVVLNRVRDSRFPNSISGVINQPSAFSCVANGAIDNTPDEACVKAARDALNGSDPTGGSLFFYNPQKTNNTFLQSLKTVATIGNHRFAK